MEISSIKIHPNPVAGAQIAATAEIILNGSLSLRGIKILRGRYGFFLAFPGLGAGTVRHAYDTLSMRFRKELQTAVLDAYRSSASAVLPLFAQSPS